MQSREAKRTGTVNVNQLLRNFTHNVCVLKDSRGPIILNAVDHAYRLWVKIIVIHIHVRRTLTIRKSCSGIELVICSK